MITVQELTKSIGEKDTVLIDVRESHEYNAGHAHDAQSYPLSQLAETAESLKSFSTIYVMCRSGGRSAMATDMLTKLGLNAVNVIGGFMAWEAEGLPVE
jgi:rhodanese-related sulfurtransferase